MSVQNIHDMDTRDKEAFLDLLADLLPSHTLKLDGPGPTCTFTWTTPKQQWSVEIIYNMGRYVVRGGENKWVRFDDDVAWLRQVLKHFEAIA